MNNYTSQDIKTLDGIQAIQLRPGMYIGGVDTDGMHHLLLEVISNSIDEYLNGHGNTITVSIDSKLNKASIKDFGRGIPFGKMRNGKEAMVELATNLHSGGKFGQGGYSVSGGLHGIGLTAVNALSTEFSITSVRGNQYAHLVCSRGMVKKYDVIDIGQKQANGTTISFIPDNKIFEDIKWNKKIIINQLKLLSYLTSGVKFILDFDGSNEVFYSEDGIKDLIREKTTDFEKITDITYIKKETKNIEVEIALQYCNTGGERTYAFTNNIPNNDGGTHVTGFRSALTSLINKKAKELELLKTSDSNFTGEMVRRGIFAAISIKMKETPIFTNQTKDKLQSPAARGAVSSVLSDIEIAKKDLEIIIKKALSEKKAEDAAKRAREASKKVLGGGAKMSMLRDLPEKLADCSSKNGELFLCEGDSAGGSAKDGRDPKTQAILALRGKVLNTFDKELLEIVENNEIKDILTTLGCGIGDKFNIRNLRYDKIILLADADVDGAHINILLSTLFLIHLPELILQGKVYRAVPPLYRVKRGKNIQYLQDDNELQKYIRKYGTPSEITRFKGLGEMSSHELWETTLNPENRKLVQMTTEDLQQTISLFKTLMGSDSTARKQYIIEHAGGRL